MEVAGADPDTWAVGFLDECWWSRVVLPTLNAWAEEGKPPRLIQRSLAKDDLRAEGHILLRTLSARDR